MIPLPQNDRMIADEFVVRRQMPAPEMPHGPCALFVALQVADFASTAAVIEHGGFEANFLSSHLIATFGVYPGLIVAKLLAVLLFWILSRIALTERAMRAVVWMYVAIILWNAAAMVRLLISA